MPFGGKYQLTETQSMVAKLPVLEGHTDTVTMMSYGFDPYLSSWSPYHGAVYAVVSSVAKIVAAGGDYKKIRFTFQEYFRRMNEDPKRWSQPFAALLGAYDAQIGFGLPSIGGKDSMSGTFNDIDVPPTLVSFAVDVAKEKDIITPELKKEGNRVLLSAADTFRAAAADQLTVWAQRAGVEIVKHEEGSDPAAVVFDSIQAAKARGVDVVIIDTAGRLHNKQNLMNELNKISRILDRELPNASKEVLLVLDGTTGQNGLLQAKQFQECAGVTGMVLTKLDGTAKGGVVIAVAQALQIPVKFIGVGEQIDDLMPFDAKSFAEALI